MALGWTPSRLLSSNWRCAACPFRPCRRAGLYEQGRAVHEKGGLNLANLTDEQQIEAEDDDRICARRGSEQEGKPKNRQRIMKRAEDVDESEEPPMTKTLHGKIHGRTIELDEDPGVPDGQEVEVQVRIVQPARKWGDGILRSAGGRVDYPEMDAIIEKVHSDRKGGKT